MSHSRSICLPVACLSVGMHVCPLHVHCMSIASVGSLIINMRSWPNVQYQVHVCSSAQQEKRVLLC
jgi:hypothetical protein